MVAAFWSSLRPVSPTTVQPAEPTAFTSFTMPGVAGNRLSWTHTSWSAGSKLKCIAASSMS